ncbi:MAG: hypothetical protein ACRDNF_00485 [Streptosporangiaceae bacterium]
MSDELEPCRHDWYQALRQNPDQADSWDWPAEADEAAGRLAADQMEDFAAIVGDVEEPGTTEPVADMG